MAYELKQESSISSHVIGMADWSDQGHSQYPNNKSNLNTISTYLENLPDLQTNLEYHISYESSIINKEALSQPKNIWI